MKKIVSILLVLTMCFALGCDGRTDNGDNTRPFSTTDTITSPASPEESEKESDSTTDTTTSPISPEESTEESDSTTDTTTALILPKNLQKSPSRFLQALLREILPQQGQGEACRVLPL